MNGGMEDAVELIVNALKNASEITPSGKTSILGLAAKALDPEASLSRNGISTTLGWHPGLVLAAMVTADLAGDTESRRELGTTLLSQIRLANRPLVLTPLGQLAVARFSLNFLVPAEPELDAVIQRAVPLLDQALSKSAPEPLEIKELEQLSRDLQRSKVVPMSKGSKSKAGVPTEEVVRRRGGQAVRAVIQGLQEDPPSEHLTLTVAGEVAGALSVGKGWQKATEFCVALAKEMEALPPEQAQRQPGNGH